MSSVIATAHPNIALVKYWGKRDTALNLPAVPSLSLTLAGFSTRTELTWGAERDAVTLNGAPAADAAARRALAFLDRVDPARPPCEVNTRNDFPTGAGLASSASGFAALALAAVAASGGDPHDLDAVSALARQGSGSACRSLWGGFVQWRLGTRADGADSIGAPVAPPDHWDVQMVVGVVSSAAKAIGSTSGMETSRQTSPYYDAWVHGGPALVDHGRSAVLARDLHALGAAMEASTLQMHAVMHTTVPPIMYWQPGTVACLHAVWALRADGVAAYATMDAGPNVKVLCATADAGAVQRALAPHVERVHVLAPGGPATVGPA